MTYGDESVTTRFAKRPFAIALLLLCVAIAGCESDDSPTQLEGPILVTLKTNQGDIVIELDTENAPISSENFLKYVDSGHFSGTIFHRVIPGFMIQGGGFAPDMSQKPTLPPIENEAGNGLKNDRGTLAMARTNVVDSATAQFFVNLVDNAFLNQSAPTPQGFGYAVFGKVTSGMEVVDAIAGVATGNHGGHGDVPTEPIVIEEAVRSE